ncbi:4Fe-4S dicluster domain-containing protein [candidate division KSB1 bacterium]|nr:4Fe-4S dicluster domain-containing protein [candidate division KSB1 bacterium]
MLTPTRELYWNIPGHLLVYAAFLVAVIVFAYGIYRRVRLWRLGQPDARFDQIGKRLLVMIRDGLAQAAVLREKVHGMAHMAIYSGMIILTIGTFLVLLQADFNIQILFGQFYLWYSLVLDLFGLIFLLGIVFAIIRRYIIRPKRLNIIADDVVILPLLLLITITGFLLEGARMAATSPEWATWSPVGNWIAGMINTSKAEGLHRAMWWVHMILSMIGIAYVPYSKLFHTLMMPANMYFKSLKPRGQLTTMDLENSETFGVTDIHEFTWKQLFDLDSCIQCGRCQDQCPAFNTDKPLSPKKLILDLQAQMEKRGPDLLKTKKSGEEVIPEPIIGDAVTEDEMWACTTCMACQEHCPASIEHVQKIVDLRRSQVLMDSKFPQELNLAFKGLETNSNPWNMGAASRADWTEGIEVKTLADNPEPDYLWFVGCAGAFDDTAKATSKALAKILNAANVNYAILGADEQCCGDPARRSGNEYVFQMLAEANVEMFKETGAKKIITACPHCFNVIKSEYPQFDGEFEVIHHSQLIAELIESGKLKLPSGKLGKAAYHDSCYLGRYHDIYNAPREILKTMTDGNLTELQHHHDKSFCCGGGGARMFMEEHIGTRINHSRIQEAADAKVETLGVACPFCLVMLKDAVKEKELEGIAVREIAEIVADQL